jgi:broad specificity phosphatase PhoE
MSRTRLLVVRHGESTWNAESRWQGKADPPLSAAGDAESVRASARLAGLPISLVVSSDLIRARRTAEIISDRLGLGRVALDPDLREVDVGQWTGLTRSEIEAGWPGAIQAWSEGRLDSTPDGEARSEFAERVLGALSRARESLQAGTAPGTGVEAPAEEQVILVITHRRVVAALEESTGIQPMRLGNLSGRWFEFDSTGTLRSGEAVELLSDP